MVRRGDPPVKLVEREFVNRKSVLKRVCRACPCRDQELRSHLTQRGKILLQDIHIDNVVTIFREERRRSIKKHDGEIILSCAETQCNAERLDRSM